MLAWLLGRFGCAWAACSGLQHPTSQHRSTPPCRPCSGHNWGSLAVEGSSMVFRIGGRPAFSLPLTDVAQAQQGRDDVMLEFPLDDTVAGAGVCGGAEGGLGCCLRACQWRAGALQPAPCTQTGTRPFHSTALHPAGDREDTLVEMSFHVPKDNADFAAAAAPPAEGGEEGEAPVAALPPAKVFFDLVSQFTDAGGWVGEGECRHRGWGLSGTASQRRAGLPARAAAGRLSLPCHMRAPAPAGAATGDAVATFDQVGVLVPRGRFDIEMYLSSLKLVGQVRRGPRGLRGAGGTWRRIQGCRARGRRRERAGRGHARRAPPHLHCHPPLTSRRLPLPCPPSPAPLMPYPMYHRPRTIASSTTLSCACSCCPRPTCRRRWW